MVRRRWGYEDAVVVWGLLWVGARLAAGALHGVDLNLGDDASHYMGGGIALHPLHLPAGSQWAVWGPLFQLWFWGLWQFKHDPVVIYYTTALALGVLLPLVFYGLLRRGLGTAWAGAFLLSWLYALAYANWLVAPRVTLFATLGMLVGWLGVTLVLREGGETWWGLAVAAAWVAYIRPEFWLSSLLFLALALGRAAKCLRREGTACVRRRAARVAPLLAASGLVLALVLWWGAPFQTGRTVYAFGQHYYYNSRFCLGRQGEAALHWEDVFQRDFGRPHSLWDALTRNPAAFGRHVACNLRHAPLEAGRLLTYHDPLLGQGRFWPEALTLVVVLLGGALVWGRALQVKGRLKVRLKSWWVVAIVVWSLPVVVSALLVYPRRHYLVPLTPLFLLLYAVLFVPRRHEARQSKGWWAAVALALVLTPPFAHFFPAGKAQQPGLDTVAVLRTLSWDRPLRISGTEGTMFFRLVPYLLPRKAQDVRMKRRDETLAHFVATVHPDVIVVGRGGLDFRDDPAWPQWLQDPHLWGYEQIILPSGDAFGPWRLFVREGLWGLKP